MFQCSPALIRLAALATFPQGKARSAYDSRLRAKAAAANQRAGQVPPLHYDEKRTPLRYDEYMENFVGNLPSDVL